MSDRLLPHRRLSRLAWATPALAVGATSVALGIIVAPTLGTQVSIPNRIMLPAASPTATATQPARPPASRPPAPKPSATASRPPAPSAHVVPPVRPIVTAPGDDSHDDNGGRTGSGSDG